MGVSTGDLTLTLVAAAVFCSVEASMSVTLEIPPIDIAVNTIMTVVDGVATTVKISPSLTIGTIGIQFGPATIGHGERSRS